MNPPKIQIHFDNRKVISGGPNDGRCHIKVLLVFYDRGIRQRRYFKTNVFANAAEFKKVQTGKYGKCDQDTVTFLDNIKTTLEGLEGKAKKCLKNFTTAEEFEKHFYSAGNFENPLDFMIAYAAEMEQAGRIGNRDNILQAHSSFFKFSKGRLTFSQVTPSWLNRYENWMGDQGRSITTVGIYCRVMRTIFNLARSDRFNTIPKELYPFGLSKHGKYQIPTSKGRKFALNEAQKNKILKYRTLNKEVQKAVDLWIFSYYCNGMNFADIASLRFKDVGEDLLVFTRRKTQLTKRDQDPIEAVMNDHVREIIARWGNKSLNPNDYIFPVLRADLTPTQISDRVHDFIADTNDGLAIACEEMDLPKITTYWARHTHATILYGKGVSIGQIKKNLGHGTDKTTENYLGSFDLDVKKKVAGML